MVDRHILKKLIVRVDSVWNSCCVLIPERRNSVNTLQQMLRHPAGRIGLTLGLALGFMAAVMGEASKALLFVGLCRFLARRIGRE